MTRVADMIAAARATTGLDDFGDESFREGLEVLVSSAEREAHLSELGELAFYGRLGSLLANRLQVEDWYRRHPEIEEQEIVAPLFGVGLPRTGSTALSFLLAEDPAARSLRTWESSKPCPPPETATEHNDPRIPESQAGLEMLDRLAPGFKTMLPMSPTGPTECQDLLGMQFTTALFEGFAVIPSYAAWVYECDMEPAYRYHRRVLKLLQWRCPPRRWRLKSPTHLLSLDALDAVYPDATFVMTHRDIADVIPSVASLMHTLIRVFTDRPDPDYLGGHVCETWELALRRGLAFRDAGHDHRFVDIGFTALQADPIAAIRSLYSHRAEPLSPAAERRMLTWWEQHPRDQYGVHRYSPADYGIDVDGVRERFRFYRDRFGGCLAAASTP